MNKNPKKWKKPNKIILFAVIAALIVIMSYSYTAYKQAEPISADLDYLTFQQYVGEGKIKSVYIVGNQKYFDATTVDDETYTVINPGHDTFKKELLEQGIDIKVQMATGYAALETAITSLLSIGIMAALLLVYTKLMGSFKGKKYSPVSSAAPVTFDQVAGMSEIKEEVRFVISQLKNAERLKELGTRPCRGIIMEGPPGTGKTLMAKAIAGEAGVPFIAVNGADFMEIFAGMGASKVRKLWGTAVELAPCVLFIDELDALGRKRSSAGDSATAEANQTLNELLARMDGMYENSGILVVGATNRVDDLDKALLRPGRFDKQLFIGPPRTKKDRDEIVQLYMKNKLLADDVELNTVSKMMYGMTGAEIEQTMNESVMVSLHRGGEGVVTLKDIEDAAMKRMASGIAVGHSSADDIKISATHEAGHAVVSCLLGRTVSKVSITPYNSGVGGLTIRDTDSVEDVKILTHKELENEIMVLLAGREAEKLLLDDTSAGCSNDIERATILAYRLIYNFAMSDDYMINPDTLQNMGMAIVDKSKSMDRVNTLVLEYRHRVDDLITLNKDKIQELANRLTVEENIYDYKIEDTNAQ